MSNGPPTSRTVLRSILRHGQLILGIALLLALAAAVIYFAQARLKIAYVETAILLTDTKIGQAAQTEIEAEIEKHRSDIAKQEQQIQVLYNLLEKNPNQQDVRKELEEKVAGYEGQVGQAAYASSKGGVIGLTICAARDLSQFGIRVNTIAPGLFLTPMMGGLPEDVQASLAAATPFPKRLGTAEEYADLVAYMYTSNIMNGETVRLDGAVRLAPR